MMGQQLAIDPAFRLFASRDLDDTRERIAAVMQPHRLTPLGGAGRFAARMSFLPLPGLGMGTIAFGRMALQLDEVEDYHLLIFCRSGQAQFSTRSGEMTIGGSHGICLAPGEKVRATFSEDCEQFVVRIDAGAMRRISGAADPMLRRRIDAADPKLRPWARLAETMTGDAATLALLRRDRGIAAQYAQLFVSAILDGHDVTDDRRRAGLAPGSIKRAEAYIDAYFAEPLTLADIASAAGVPVRTLTYAYRQFRGSSPMRQLRDRRLDHAAKLLRDGCPGVAEAATASGFSHLGRFSQDYRARFGESPSISLRRSR